MDLTLKDAGVMLGHQQHKDLLHVAQPEWGCLCFQA